MSMALEGDVAAMRLCLERLLPARKERAVNLELPSVGTAQQNSAAISSIFAAIGDGEITPAEGEIMTNILAAQNTLFQGEELEKRLQAVEERMKPKEADE